MNILPLVDDDKSSELNSEHGFSLYIEYLGKHLLFDTGSSDIYLKNAEKLGVDLNDLDYIFVSHGHYDHGNGLKSLLPALSAKTKIYVGKEFFDKKYKHVDGDYVYNGVNISKNEVTVNFIEENIQIDDILIFKNFKKNNSFETINKNFYVTRKNDQKELDDFRDEIVLGLKYLDGIILICGCSHIGICNIIASVKALGYKVLGVIGGSHLIHADDNRLNNTINYVNSLNLKLVSFCHCSGEKNIEIMQEKIPNFIKNYPGKQIKL